MTDKPEDDFMLNEIMPKLKVVSEEKAAEAMTAVALEKTEVIKLSRMLGYDISKHRDVACSGCGVTLFVSPMTPPTPRTICQRCLMDEAGEDDVHVTSQAALDRAQANVRGKVN